VVLPLQEAPEMPTTSGRTHMHSAVALGPVFMTGRLLSARLGGQKRRQPETIDDQRSFFLFFVWFKQVFSLNFFFLTDFAWQPINQAKLPGNQSTKRTCQATNRRQPTDNRIL